MITPEQEAAFRARLESENPPETDPQFASRLATEQINAAKELRNPVLWALGGAGGAYLGGRAVNAFGSGKVDELIAKYHVPPEVVSRGDNAVINYINSQFSGDIKYVGGEHYGEGYQKTLDAIEKDRNAPPGKRYDPFKNTYVSQEEFNANMAARVAEEQKKTSLVNRILQKSPAAAQTAAGVRGVLQKTLPPFVGRTAAGGYGGYTAAQALNRASQGDYPGAAISGVGTAGSAASLSTNPKTRAVGLGLMGLSALGNSLYTSPTFESPGFLDAAKYLTNPQQKAAGGLAHLEGGGSPKVRAAKTAADMLVGRGPKSLKDILESKQAPMLRPSGEGPLLPQVSNPYIAELPDVLPQKRLIRGTNPRLERLISDPRAYEAIEKAMQHGVNIDPKLAHWYGTNRLLTGMQNEGSTFEDFDRLMKHMASASQRNPVPQQNKMGSLLNYYDVAGQLGAPGSPLSLPKGYGSLAQGDIIKRAQEIGAGQYPFDDAIKLGKFYKSYLGYHPENAVVDVIGTRVPTMATRDPEWLAKSVKMGNKKEGFQVLRPREMFERGELTMEDALKRPGFWTAAPEKVGEYAGIEDMWKSTAKGQGYKSGEGQALGWYGSAGLDDAAGLKSKPMTWEESLEQRARDRARETGRHPLDVMTDFLQLKGHLKQGGLA